MRRRLLTGLDERTGSNVLLRKTLRYVFPDHWSFMLGEVALYCFVVLVATGIFLSLFFDPSYARTTYEGPYDLLRGREMSAAYASMLDISFEVPGGLLVRQTHHWAALVFVVAIVLHLMRIFFTGAFRKPRELNYMIGVTMLGLAIFEGFAGYSLGDDLVSGMGLAIAYGVGMSIPLVGGDVSHAFFNGEFPGGTEVESRLYALHVLLVPAIIATLVAMHLALIVRARHTDFPGPAKSERTVVGTPLWPGYALRSAGLLALVAAVLLLLGGLVQINPIWQWGPYEPYLGTNGAQPDWYLGWLIGGLRLMPPLEIVVGGYTLVPNPFFAGLLFPTAVFGLLYGWPWLEQRLITRDRERRELLDRPRDNPQRTAVGAAIFTFVFTVFAAGAADRAFLASGIAYETQIWIFRGALLVLPVTAYAIAKRTCRRLRESEAHPLREWAGDVVERTESGGYVRRSRSDSYQGRPGGPGGVSRRE